MDKAKLQVQIAKGQIKPTIDKLLKWAKQQNDDALEHDLMLLSNDYRAYQRAERNGTHDNSELRQMRNLVLSNLIGLVDDLPENQQEARQRKRRMSAGTLKWVIAALLFVGKLILLNSLDFHQRTGGIPPNEFWAIVGFLLPIFVAYLTIIIRERFKSEHSINNFRTANTSMVVMTLVLIPLYVFLFWLFIQRRAMGDLSSENMTLALSMIESSLGAFIGVLVLELFKTDE